MLGGFAMGFLVGLRAWTFDLFSSERAGMLCSWFWGTIMREGVL